MQYFRPYIAQSLTKQKAFSRDSVDAHRSILDAIRRRDDRAAEAAVEASNATWESLILTE